MKQKYSISRNDEKDELIIREFAELDKEILSFLCEETYKGDIIRTAAEKGQDHLIAALRTKNLYPPALFIGKIAEAAAAMYGTDTSPDENQPRELFFNDFDFLTRAPEIHKEVPEDIIEEEPEDIDELLEDDIEDFDDKEGLTPINTSIKIADDDVLDIEDDL